MTEEVPSYFNDDVWITYGFHPAQYHWLIKLINEHNWSIELIDKQPTVKHNKLDRWWLLHDGEMLQVALAKVTVDFLPNVCAKQTCAIPVFLFYNTHGVPTITSNYQHQDGALKFYEQVHVFGGALYHWGYPQATSILWPGGGISHLHWWKKGRK